MKQLWQMWIGIPLVGCIGFGLLALLTSLPMYLVGRQQSLATGWNYDALWMAPVAALICLSISLLGIMTYWLTKKKSGTKRSQATS